MAASTDFQGSSLPVTDGPDSRRRMLNLLGFLLSAGWLAICALYVDREIGWGNLGTMLPHELGLTLTGTIAPLVFLWLVIVHFSGRHEVRDHTRVLRQQMRGVARQAALDPHDGIEL